MWLTVSFMFERRGSGTIQRFATTVGEAGRYCRGRNVPRSERGGSSSRGARTGRVMRRVGFKPSYGLRGFVFGALAAGTALTFSSAPVDARYHRYYVRHTG